MPDFSINRGDSANQRYLFFGDKGSIWTDSMISRSFITQRNVALFTAKYSRPSLSLLGAIG